MTLGAQMRPTWGLATFRLLVLASGLLALPTAGGAAEPGNEPVPPTGEAMVRLREHRLFSIRVSRGGTAAEQRARDATKALNGVLEAPGDRTVRYEEEGEQATLFAGNVPILQFGPEDAVAAGDASLRVHAANAVAIVNRALRAEERRQRLQDIVLNISLVVFVGLIVFLIVRKLGELEGAVERWLDSRPQGTPAVRLGNVELASERAVRAACT